MSKELREKVRAFLKGFRSDPEPTDKECEAFCELIVEAAKPAKAAKK
jgi:hypothetical protein